MDRRFGPAGSTKRPFDAISDSDNYMSDMNPDADPDALVGDNLPEVQDAPAGASAPEAEPTGSLVHGSVDGNRTDPGDPAFDPLCACAYCEEGEPERKADDTPPPARMENAHDVTATLPSSMIDMGGETPAPSRDPDTAAGHGHHIALPPAPATVAVPQEPAPAGASAIAGAMAAGAGAPLPAPTAEKLEVVVRAILPDNDGSTSKGVIGAFCVADDGSRQPVTLYDMADGLSEEQTPKALDLYGRLPPPYSNTHFAIIKLTMCHNNNNATAFVAPASAGKANIIRKSMKQRQRQAGKAPVGYLRWSSAGTEASNAIRLSCITVRATVVPGHVLDEGHAGGFSFHAADDGRRPEPLADVVAQVQGNDLVEFENCVSVTISSAEPQGETVWVRWQQPERETATRARETSSAAASGAGATFTRESAFAEDVMAAFNRPDADSQHGAAADEPNNPYSGPDVDRQLEQLEQKAEASSLCVVM